MQIDRQLPNKVCALIYMHIYHLDPSSSLLLHYILQLIIIDYMHKGVIKSAISGAE